MGRAAHAGRHAAFADDDDHVVIEVLAANSELFAWPLPNWEGVVRMSGERLL